MMTIYRNRMLRGFGETGPTGIGPIIVAGGLAVVGTGIYLARRPRGRR